MDFDRLNVPVEDQKNDNNEGGDGSPVVAIDPDAL